MIKAVKNRLWPLEGVIHAIMVIVSLIMIDALLRGTVADLRTIRLKSMGETGRYDIGSDLRVLGDEIAGAERALSTLAQRRFPGLPDLKNTASRYRLRLTRTEPVRGAGQPREGQRWYRISFRGSMGNLVKFLADVEDSFLCQIAAVEIEAVDSGGNSLELRMTINTGAP